MTDALNARGRILALLEILTMYTDEHNTLTAEQLCEKLSEYGYEITKRTVLSDIKVIEQSPYDIVKVSREKGYYIIKTNDAMAIRKIIAAAFSSPMISKNDVEEIKRYLDRNSCIATLNTIYGTSESFTCKTQKSRIPFDLILPIREAIKTKRRVKLTYTVINPGDGYSEPYITNEVIINPIKLVISSNSHALIFSLPKTPDKPEFINIHRISSVSILSQRQNNECSEHLNATNFFNSEPLISDENTSEWLVLKFKKEYSETVDSFFSVPVQYKKNTNDAFTLAKVNYPINKELVGWLYTNKDIIEVVTPAKLKDIL